MNPTNNFNCVLIYQARVFVVKSAPQSHKFPAETTRKKIIQFLIIRFSRAAIKSSSVICETFSINLSPLLVSRETNLSISQSLNFSIFEFLMNQTQNHPKRTHSFCILNWNILHSKPTGFRKPQYQESQRELRH